MSDNCVVLSLQDALATWNEKMAEVWTLLTMSPEKFKGGSIWNVILNITGAIQAMGNTNISICIISDNAFMIPKCGMFDYP